MNRLFLLLFAITALMSSTSPLSAQSKSSSPAEAKTPVMVNLNTATVTELQELPGIGASTAARIVEYRQKNGPFKKTEELMNVRGVGEKSFLKLRSQVTVAAKPDGRSQQ